MAEHRERLLIARYLQERYPHHQKQTNVPLGLPAPQLIAEFGLQTALRIGIKMRPNVDAIVWDKPNLILIEAKIVRWVDGIAKLPFYEALFLDTPEMEQWFNWPRRLVLVIPYSQENMLAVARRMGVEIVEYSTPEIDNYLQKELPYYQTGDYKRKRAELLSTQEALGVRTIDGL